MRALRVAERYRSLSFRAADSFACRAVTTSNKKRINSKGALNSAQETKLFNIPRYVSRDDQTLYHAFTDLHSLPIIVPRLDLPAGLNLPLYARNAHASVTNGKPTFRRIGCREQARNTFSARPSRGRLSNFASKSQQISHARICVQERDSSRSLARVARGRRTTGIKRLLIAGRA